MSHFSTLKTTMTSLTAIQAALEELGYTVEIHAEGDWLRNIFSQGNQHSRANIIVRREQVKRYKPEEIERFVSRSTLDPAALQTKRREWESEGVGVDVGLELQADGTYAWVADDYYPAVTALKAKLQHLYPKHVISFAAAELGQSFSVTERTENGQFAGWRVEVDQTPATRWTSASTGAATQIRQRH